MLTAVLRPVASGITMTGICKSDDPDEIQACVWVVNPAEGGGGAAVPKPKFRIEF